MAAFLPLVPELNPLIPCVASQFSHLCSDQATAFPGRNLKDCANTLGRLTAPDFLNDRLGNKSGISALAEMRAVQPSSSTTTTVCFAIEKPEEDSTVNSMYTYIILTVYRHPACVSSDTSALTTRHTPTPYKYKRRAKKFCSHIPDSGYLQASILALNSANFAVKLVVANEDMHPYISKKGLGSIALGSADSQGISVGKSPF
ncbi:hypothetical protein C8R44DRAFT_749951 [Mycena epipterygia]|nr:hypothetical protein C8R44DRAFT_749951 [Mycena epipterygia]